MPDDQAKIIVGASPVAAGRRHTYLLFEQSDGHQIVVRGGPDRQTEGNDSANLVENTLFGSDKFGHIKVDAAPYVPPHDIVYRKQADGFFRPLPIDQANPDDPRLKRDAQGKIEVEHRPTPDWPHPGEQHERRVIWTGTDQELANKLDSALRAKEQINNAQLEYSPLRNNSNGVTSTLLKSADVQPTLPLGKDGKPVDTPNFGENLYQNVGAASIRSGYWFDGKQWYDGNKQKIQPPHSGQPVVRLNPEEQEKSRSGSFHSDSSPLQNSAQQEKQASARFTPDPNLARLVDALHSGDEAAFSRVCAEIAQSPKAQALLQRGRDDLAAQQREQQQQQEMRRGRGRSLSR